MERLIKILDITIFFLLCILVFCLPFSNAIIEICAGNVIGWWLIKRILRRRLFKENLLPKSFLSLPILLYLAVLLISSIQGTNFLISARHLIRKTLEYAALYFVIIDTFNSRKRLRIFLTVLLCSISLITIDGIIQYFTRYEFLRQRVIIAGRIAGPFEYPDGFGNYLVMILPLVIVSSLYKFKVRYFTYLLRIITFILIFLLFTNVTKGAWIGFIVSLVFLAMFFQKKKSLTFILIFLIMAFFMLTPSFKSHIFSQFDMSNPSITQRFDLWQTGWNMFIDRPLFGQGLGTYMNNYEKYQTPRPRPVGQGGLWYAHNSYLQILAENGIIGLVSFLTIIFILFKRTSKLIIRRENGYLFNLLFGLTTGMLAYLIQIFFDSTFYSLPNSVLFWYILSVLVATVGLIEKKA
jgi:O-antigen ligase